MYPALISGLTRLAATTRWTRFVAVLNNAAGTSMKTLGEVLTWARSNKGAAALIASCLVEAGISIADFVRNPGAKPDAASAELGRELSKYVKAGPAVGKLIAEILGGDGDKLSLDLSGADEQKEMVARAAVSFIRDRLLIVGSGEGAVASMLELHSALQLFTNMKRNDVEALLRNRLAPLPQYNAATMRPYLLAD